MPGIEPKSAHAWQTPNCCAISQATYLEAHPNYISVTLPIRLHDNKLDQLLLIKKSRA